MRLDRDGGMTVLVPEAASLEANEPH